LVSSYASLLHNRRQGHTTQRNKNTVKRFFSYVLAGEFFYFSGMHNLGADDFGDLPPQNVDVWTVAEFV
jgi:hypothetical protein